MIYIWCCVLLAHRLKHVVPDLNGKMLLRERKEKEKEKENENEKCTMYVKA